MSIDFSKYDRKRETKGEFHYLRFNKEQWNEITEFFNSTSPTSVKLRLLGLIKDINQGVYKIVRGK